MAGRGPSIAGQVRRSRAATGDSDGVSSREETLSKAAAETATSAVIRILAMAIFDHSHRSHRHVALVRRHRETVAGDLA